MAKFNDIRMKGFASRADVKDAWALLHSRVKALPAETVAHQHLCGRVLAEDVVSVVNVPGYNRAAMDGYAVIASNTFGAEATNPISFTLVGESMPGATPIVRVNAGEAVRIMTGAPLPLGADAVVPVEVTEERGKNEVAIREAVTPGRHVGKVGEDVQSGITVLQSGRVVRPQDVGLLSAIGLNKAQVVRQPHVAILVTGNELLPPGEVPSSFQIVDANSPMLEALATRDGAATVTVTRLKDNYDTIHAAIKETTADVILVSGGSSVGKEDHAPKALAEIGTLNIHGLNLRPASPTGIGFRGETLVMLLPGNPVSCLCAYDLFGGLWIRALGGRPFVIGYTKCVLKLEEKIVSSIGRMDYVRVKFTSNGVIPIAISGASILSSTVKADGFVLVEPECEGYDVGENVIVYCYDSSPSPAGTSYFGSASSPA